MIERLDILAALAALRIEGITNSSAYPTQMEDIGSLIDVNWEGWSELEDALKEMEREDLVFQDQVNTGYGSKTAWGITPAGLVKVFCR